MFCIGHMTTLVAMELVYSEQSCAHLKPRVSTVMKSARKATRKCPTVSDTIFNTHLFYLGRPFRRHFFFLKCMKRQREKWTFHPLYTQRHISTSLLSILWGEHRFLPLFSALCLRKDAIFLAQQQPEYYQVQDKQFTNKSIK